VRILLLNDGIPPASSGGAERVAWSLAQGLAAAGHDVHFVATTPGGTSSEERGRITVDQLHTSYPGRFNQWAALHNPQTVRPVREIARRVRPDVVHAHNVQNRLSFDALRVISALGMPVVYTAHDASTITEGALDHFVRPDHMPGSGVPDYRIPPFHNLGLLHFRYNPFHNRVIRAQLARYTRLRTCVSNAQRLALEANRIPPLTVVYSGVDPSALAVDDATVGALSSRLGLDDRKIVLFAGRFTERKGRGPLLEAFSRVVDRVPDAALLILTSKATWQNLDIDVDDARLRNIDPEHVYFPGWMDTDELAAAYQLADVVTVPSLCLETASMVAMEAMFAGRPVVGTCFGGVPELVTHGECGIIVNPLQVDAYADHLVRLLTDDTLREEMGVAGRQRALEHFTLDAYVERTVACYERALVR
jgi:glycosyltransferase involved in cell wall biosynthesis